MDLIKCPLPVFVLVNTWSSRAVGLKSSLEKFSGLTWSQTYWDLYLDSVLGSGPCREFVKIMFVLFFPYAQDVVPFSRKYPNCWCNTWMMLISWSKGFTSKMIWGLLSRSCLNLTFALASTPLGLSLHLISARPCLGLDNSGLYCGQTITPINNTTPIHH